jgi:hypothetical protein
VALTKFNYNSFDLTTAASKGLAFNSSANGFETAAEGSMTLIKTITASNDATIDFVDGTSSVVLDSTYPVYLFKMINVHGITDDTQFKFQGNSSGGSGFNETITSTYFKAGQNEAGDYTILGYGTGSDQAQGTGYQTISENMGNANDECGSGELYLFNPSSTTFVKHFLVKLQHQQHASQSYQSYTAGYFNTTSAIDEISFKFASGNIDSGTFKLYGIKDS